MGVQILKPEAMEFFKGIFGSEIRHQYRFIMLQRKYSYNNFEYFVDKNKYISGGVAMFSPYIINLINIASKNIRK